MCVSFTICSYVFDYDDDGSALPPTNLKHIIRYTTTTADSIGPQTQSRRATDSVDQLTNSRAPKERSRNFTSIIIHLSLSTVAFLLHSVVARAFGSLTRTLSRSSCSGFRGLHWPLPRAWTLTAIPGLSVDYSPDCER